MTLKTYEVVEALRGWRVLERHSTGEKFHDKVFPTQAEALRRVEYLHAHQLKLHAITEVRKRARFRCECMGECRRHEQRCPLIEGAPILIGVIELKVVALDHNEDNLRLTNLRTYCQLCRQHYDADARNTDALFEIG